jgi:two-component system NtrC family sensor kinase
VSLAFRPDGMMVSAAPRHVRSLYFKVVIPIVALVLAGMGAVAFFAMRAMSEGVRQVAAQRAHYGLASVQGSFEDVEHLNMADRGASMQRLIERLGLSPDLDTVRILSASGKVLYSSKRTEVGQMMPAHRPAAPASADGAGAVQAVAGQPALLHTADRIVNQPRCAQCHAREDHDMWAFADVDVSLSRQSAGMRTWETMADTAAVAQFTIIGIGVALILGLVVVRPVRRLAESMSQVQHGNLEVTAVPPGTIEIDGLVAGFNDMVARLRHARQVEQDAQRSHLTRVERLATIGEMAAGLAHEIRNPLSGTKAAIDVLAGAETVEETRRILRSVSEELARVDGVVRQLLNFAKPKTPVLAKVNLRALLDDAVMLSGPRAAAQGATLEVRSTSETQHVRADADMVLQVIVNLLINALQALEGVNGAAVVVSTGIRDGQAACSVRDNGPGVPADRADTIFHPFMTTKARGTGLGLATSRRLIELQGGRLWLENPGAPGACFTFTLPAFTAQEGTGV